MRKALLAAALIALFAIGVLAYRLIEPRSVTLASLRASNGTEYSFFVHVPPACRNGGCQALYVLDGLAWLPTFAELEEQLSAQHRTRPIAIVGIAYADALRTGELRKHDFTPAFGRTPNRTGGADAFLAVLRDEIIPYAERSLPIDSSTRGLAGHSYAGLFAAYALATAPELFHRYLIMSPALWFDEGKIFDVPLAPADQVDHVFLAADTPRDAPRSAMANDMLRLSEHLKARPRLDVSHALIVGEDHNGMVAPAARRGLLALYGEPAP